MKRQIIRAKHVVARDINQIVTVPAYGQSLAGVETILLAQRQTQI